MRQNFISLLRDNNIDRHQKWADVKKVLDSKDLRYKAVMDSVLREDYFYEYCRLVKEENKAQV